MTISTFATLKTSLADWMHRSDLTAVIPDFITLAEEKLNSDLMSRSMDAISTVSTVAGTATISMPSDLVELRRLQVVGDPNQVLSYRSPDEISQDYPSARQGKPVVFTVIGSTFELAPIPDGVYSISITYKQRIPALSDSNTTNWVLTSWPAAYLFGSLCAAQPYIIGDARIPMFQAMYKEAVNGINSVDWYSGTTMKVRVI